LDVYFEILFFHEDKDDDFFTTYLLSNSSISPKIMVDLLGKAEQNISGLSVTYNRLAMWPNLGVEVTFL
jgi:hypothetical protein